MSSRKFRSQSWVNKHRDAVRELGPVNVGGVVLGSPVLTASGTAGHSDELGKYFDMRCLGATVVKSLSSFAWQGNPSPRVHPTAKGMINAVGLQGPGLQVWIEEDLPRLVAGGVSTVVSIWGRTVEEYREAAKILADVDKEHVIAVEVNLSCPNLEGRNGIFAHDAEISARVIDSAGVANRPLWAKLSPNTDRIIEVAGAVAEAGAQAVTLVNTSLGMVIDTESGLPALGNGGGGLSGAAIHPIAVRAVYDVHGALPDLDIIGVGGIQNGEDAIELMMAGAKAIQVGTATFADPYAAIRVSEQMLRWMKSHHYGSWSSIHLRG